MNTFERLTSYNLEFKLDKNIIKYIKYSDRFESTHLETYGISVVDFDFYMLKVDFEIYKSNILNNLHYLKKCPKLLEKERKYWTDYYDEKINKCIKIINFLKNE